MSLRTMLGPRHPILSDGPEAAELLVLKSFFLYPSAVVELLTSDPGFGVAHLDATFRPSDGPGSLRAAVAGLCDKAEELRGSGRTSASSSSTTVGWTRTGPPSPPSWPPAPSTPAW